MGFFSKIGKGLKGLTKMVSLKNLKNVVSGPTGWSSIGVEAADRTTKGLLTEFTRRSRPSKMTKGQRAMEAYNDAQAIALSARNPNIKEILTSALGGALTSAGGTIAQGQTGQDVLVNTADSTISAWFKKNLLKVLGGVALLVAFVVLIRRAMAPKPKAKYGRN